MTLAPDDPTRLWDLAGIEDRLGELALTRGELAEAREHFAALQRLIDELVARDPTNRDWRWGLAGTLQKLGGVERRAGNLTEARGFLTQSLALMDELAPARPESRSWRWDRALSAEKLGTICLELGDAAAAREHLTTALVITERLCEGSADPGAAALRASVLESLIACHRRLGAEAEAIACERLLAALRQPAPAQNPTAD